MLALHNECLTNCNLLDRLNLLEGLLGFGFGISRALEGLSKLGLLSLRFTLQGLIFLDEILELLLDLADPASCFSHAACSMAALSSALASAFLRAATSVVAPIKVHDASISQNHLSFISIQMGHCVP